ncbi:hypothetical protein AGIG_G11178 [Arapaima gigas]
MAGSDGELAGSPVLLACDRTAVPVLHDNVGDASDAGTSAVSLSLKGGVGRGSAAGATQRSVRWSGQMQIYIGPTGGQSSRPFAAFGETL